MRILVTGGNGQLGRALARRARGHRIQALGRSDLDVAAPDAAARIAAAAPDAVVNAAAMTDVDGCEGDPEAAFRVNAIGARNVAAGAYMADAPVVQISTDYVFSGRKGEAYWEFDPPGPVNTYGESKLAGERMAVAVNPRTFIARSAWLYGVGGSNFVNRILALAAEKSFLEVVDGEVGSPTYCDDLADAILALVSTTAYGVHHLVNEGACSRLDFARAILDRAGRSDYPVRQIDHYQRAASPPTFAPLRNFVAAQMGIRLPPWESGLDRFFERRAVARA